MNNRGVFRSLLRLRSLIKLSLQNRKPSSTVGMTTMESILTGLIAGSITVVVTNPIWVVNTRMTVSKSNKSFLRQLVSMAKTEPLSNLFNGLVPSLILVLNPIIQYTIYEQFKNFLIKVRSKKMDSLKGVNGNGNGNGSHSKANVHFSSLDAFFIGAVGKLIATALTYPYITLKTRSHLNNNRKADKADEDKDDEDKEDDGNGDKNENKSENKDIIGTIKEMYENEGILSFYNGISVKLFQSILNAAFLFYFKQEFVTLSLFLIRMIKRRQKGAQLNNM